MKIKPYTGDVVLWARGIVEALTGRLTVRDNVAALAVSVVWDESQGVVLEALPQIPRSIVVLRASLQSTPGSYVSGGDVTWEILADGRIQVTGIGPLAVGVWDVELLLVED